MRMRRGENSNGEKQGRRRRRLHWHVGFWMLALIAVLTFFVLLASMSLTGRVAILPPWVTAWSADLLLTLLGAWLYLRMEH